MTLSLATLNLKASFIRSNISKHEHSMMNHTVQYTKYQHQYHVISRSELWYYFPWKLHPGFRSLCVVRNLILLPTSAHLLSSLYSETKVQQDVGSFSVPSLFDSVGQHVDKKSSYSSPRHSTIKYVSEE